MKTIYCYNHKELVKLISQWKLFTVITTKNLLNWFLNENNISECDKKKYQAEAQRFYCESLTYVLTKIDLSEALIPVKQSAPTLDFSNFYKEKEAIILIIKSNLADSFYNFILPLQRYFIHHHTLNGILIVLLLSRFI